MYIEQEVCLSIDSSDRDRQLFDQRVLFSLLALIDVCLYLLMVGGNPSFCLIWVLHLNVKSKWIQSFGVFLMKQKIKGQLAFEFPEENMCQS